MDKYEALVCYSRKYVLKEGCKKPTKANEPNKDADYKLARKYKVLDIFHTIDCDYIGEDQYIVRFYTAQ